MSLVCLIIVLSLHDCIFMVTRLIKMEILPTMFRKAKEDNSSVWVDQGTFDTTLIFAPEGSLDRAFI